MSKSESGLSTISGSRTNERLKGSDVGTRAEYEDGNHSRATTYQELRRRTFFQHSNRARRPSLQRRNAVYEVPWKPVTTIVETMGNAEDAKLDDRDPSRLAPTDIPSLGLQYLTVPAVPSFPSLLNPTVPTVPSYPFHVPSSQSVLSSPPSSPVPSDISFTPTASPTPNPAASPTASPIMNSSGGSTSLGSSSNDDVSATSDSTRPTSPVSTINVLYSNTTLITSTRSSETANASSITPSDAAAVSTSTSDSFQQSTLRSTASGAAGAAGAAATLTATATAPVSIGTSGTSSNSDESLDKPVSPNTPQVVGGVVGGVAGVAVILLVILYFLRRYRKHLQDRGELLEPDAPRRDAVNTMSMRSSHTPLVAAVAASFKKMRPGSSNTTATADTGTSDRGFQRVAGRKIDPVLVSGGDGYGGNYGAFEKEAALNKETGAPSSSLPEAQPLAGRSFYRDNADFDSRQNSRTSTPLGGQARFSSASHGLANDQDDDYYRGPSPDIIAVMRPSPARSPVTTSAGPYPLAPHSSGPALPGDAPPTPTLPSRYITPDGVGRSLASQDSSRGSRFTESV
ncbi:hypothetical protein EPUS_05008 [Endocarpon pusillum Z07020]|uniref:Uncharacterized protein n=1 Tax=Endocarpon pusillum (strain Z07020 / HMAS-L-300199) TaxID=1263415 RepID=U1HNY3_ENDPU|nr:uncharacterized protein EPUS_05008 [Endocarpon pusillum Z07020]ERF72090.1 hypothetical protein EPUS_05008 [Endocarpon pusillum Z07020]